MTWNAPALAELTATVPAELQAACEKANTMAYAICRIRSTCVLTSHALAAYLREVEGVNADPVRIEVHIHPECGYGSTLGWDGDGSRRPAAGPDKWHGHLAVVCGDFLLDPTIDQVNDENMHLPAGLVLPLPTKWDDGHAVTFVDAEGTFARFSKYHRQVGWKSAGDARPKYWRPVVDLMLEGDHLWGKS